VTSSYPFHYVPVTLQYDVTSHGPSGHGATGPSGPEPLYYRGFTISLRRTTVGRTPLDKWSSRRKELSTWQHTTLSTEKVHPQEGFRPLIPAREKPQTHAFDRAFAGTGHLKWYCSICNIEASFNAKQGKMCYICPLFHFFSFSLWRSGIVQSV